MKTPAMTIRPRFLCAVLSLAIAVACGGGAPNSNSVSSTGSNGSTGGNNANNHSTWVHVGNTGMQNDLWIQFDRQGNLYASSSRFGVAVSQDHGVNWAPLNSGLAEFCHDGMGLAADGTVLVGDEYCSANQHNFYWLNNVSGSGTIWTAASTNSVLNTGAFVNNPTVAHNGTLVAGSFNGIWYSTNNGRSYQRSPGAPTLGTYGEAVSAFTGPDGTVYIGTALKGVLYSLDNGLTFHTLGYPSGWAQTAVDVMDITIVPQGPLQGQLLVGFGSGHETYCYGPLPPPQGTWKTCKNGLHGADVEQFATDPSKSKVFVVHAKGGGVYSSTDGQNWTAVNSGLPPDSSQPFGQADVRSIATDPATGIMYVILNQGDVYRTALPQ